MVESDKGSHWILTTFEDSCLIPVICQLVDYIDRNLLPTKTYNRIAFDLLALKIEETDSLGIDYTETSTFSRHRQKRLDVNLRLHS
jgi:hypothetical protein